jgi:BirA family biotin operon repressor/biotin-[acetyl-CoA-carboxylase] ligase
LIIYLKASSLAVICGVEFDKEQLLYRLLTKKQTIDLVQQQSDHLRLPYGETFKIGFQCL